MVLRIWPQQLIGRIIIVLMGALALEFIGSSLIYEAIDVRTTRVDQATHLAEQLVVADRVLTETPAPDRVERARALSSDKVMVGWGAPHPLVVRPEGPIARRLHGEMLKWEPSLAGRDLRLMLDRGSPLTGQTRLIVSLKLPDGSSTFVSSSARSSPVALLVAAVGSAATLSIGVLVVSVALLRNLGLPLRSLARAADGVGQGAPIYVREEGASDVRRVAHAFNAMQTRISDLVSARTRALAAVSHDLRTPLSRVRLRAGLVEDAETRTALERDIDEMSSMLGSLLQYLGGAHEMEASRLTDVAAICITLVDAATDAGGDATYVGPERQPILARTGALKRAIDNLVQNAVIYGGRADVSLFVDGEGVTVRVEDEGPGIAEADFERVTEAFVRLDHARTRNTTGLGLGLSIVQSVAEQEGGTFVLANRPEGGLRAELRLPHPG